MNTKELAYILYLLIQRYGEEKGSKLFDKIIKSII